MLKLELYLQHKQLQNTFGTPYIYKMEQSQESKQHQAADRHQHISGRSLLACLDHLVVDPVDEFFSS